MNTERYPRAVAPDTAPDASSLSSRRGVAILILLSIVQFMDVLDASILNIALPSIKQALGFNQQSLQWAIDGYITYGGFPFWEARRRSARPPPNDGRTDRVRRLLWPAASHTAARCSSTPASRRELALRCSACRARR